MKSIANCRFERLAGATSAGTTTINSAVFLVDGATNVAFIVALSGIVAGHATKLQIQTGDASDASDMANVGSEFSVSELETAGVVVAELVRPLKAYARVRVIRATQNVAIESIVGVAGNDRVQPAPQTVTFRRTQIDAK